MAFQQKLGAQLIILEGNISAGKTTLVKQLGKILGARTFLEPTAANPFLEKFYQEPKKYALKLQLWIFRQRYNTYLAGIKYIQETGNAAILDRSVYSDWVFAEKNRQDGNISDDGFAYYDALRNSLLSRLPLPHYTVYLDVSADECYRRVHTMRKRDCEAGIPLEYLSGLDACYDQFVENMKKRGSCTLRVPWEGFGDPNALANRLYRARKETSLWPKIDLTSLQYPRLDKKLLALSQQFEDSTFLDQSPDIEKKVKTEEEEQDVPALSKDAIQQSSIGSRRIRPEPPQLSDHTKD